MSEEIREAGEHLREIAAQIRRLARDASVAEAQEELFDLADILDRMAERAKKTSGRDRGRGERLNAVCQFRRRFAPSAIQLAPLKPSAVVKTQEGGPGSRQRSPQDRM